MASKGQADSIGEAVTDEIPLLTLTHDEESWQATDEAERETFVRWMADLERTGKLARQGRPESEWAYIDLDEYSDIDEYVARCRKVYKGNAVRDALKAERLGYRSHFFHPRLFVGDLVDINKSAPERQGRPMSGHYQRGVEERGGYASEYLPPPIPAERFTWSRYWGIFLPSPGHKQGDVQVDERLVGYIILRRAGEFAAYGTILGHHDLLHDGIMYKLHIDLIRHLLENRHQGSEEESDETVKGLRYVFYAAYFGLRGLQLWKAKMLFRPGYFCWEYPV